MYQHLFFKGLGNNVARVISRTKDNTDIDKITSIENLVPDCINYNEINKVNNFLISPTEKKKEQEKQIKYTLNEKEIPISINELLFFYDVSNGLKQDQRYKSPSRIDAILPSLQNITQAQKSKNINLVFSAKHLISGKKQGDHDPFKETVLGQSERDDIENNVYHKDILVNPNGVEVHNLAVDFRKLMYDESAGLDMLKVSNTYRMGKDVINWLVNGSTYENQSMAVPDWIQDDIASEGEDFGYTYANHFGFTDNGESITMKFDHLSQMQILEEKRMQAIEKKIAIANGLVGLGMDQKQAMEKAGLNELA